MESDQLLPYQTFTTGTKPPRVTVPGSRPKMYVCLGVKTSATITIDDKTTSTTAGGSGSTPTPVQEGMVSGCKDFYLVQSGDGCWAIANANGIELTDFYEWNPAIEDDCTNLQANVYVCTGKW